MDAVRLIRTARGEEPADLLLANARIVNVCNGEIESGSVAITGGFIAGTGDYRQAKEILDLAGAFVLPGFIDGHTHIESSMLDIAQYARAVVPHGTTTAITDLHEIANVGGMAGIDYIMAGARRLPLSLFLMAPSCVPATPFETAGARLDAGALRPLLRREDCLGLGEMMNFPGVLNADQEVLAKMRAAASKTIDGHAPGLSGNDLNAYIAAGAASDHESIALAEAQEKLARGMYLMIREGSAEKNLAALLPLVTDKTYHRCLLVVDDRSCTDLLRDGDMDAVVRRAIALGLEPVRAVTLATLNPARYYGLKRRGAVAPGCQADLVVTRDLEQLPVDMVFYRGKLVARQGKVLFKTKAESAGRLTGTVNIQPFTLEALKLKAKHAVQAVIEVVPGQIVTRKLMLEVAGNGGEITPDTGSDLLKAVVVERHRATGNIGVGLVRGFGLKDGALASSVAHDSHNIVAVGASDRDILAAVKEIERLGGGLVVAAGGEILGSLPLPVAGLLSPEPLDVVAARFSQLEALAGKLGTTLPAPFSALSFLALPVIPEIRLTERGLFDVKEFRFIE